MRTSRRARPRDRLDVRDLSYRALSQWRAHRKTDGKAAYISASDLLRRALALAPEDPLAIELTANVNLCDCINGWSTDPDQQKALGADALNIKAKALLRLAGIGDWLHATDSEGLRRLDRRRERIS